MGGPTTQPDTQNQPVDLLDTGFDLLGGSSTPTTVSTLPSQNVSDLLGGPAQTNDLLGGGIMNSVPAPTSSSTMYGLDGMMQGGGLLDLGGGGLIGQ